MQKFIIHKGIACPLEYANIDTDQIIPKQFLLAVSKQGFGKHLFHDLRYLDDKESVLNMDFNLNKKEYQNSSILVSFENFGSGSSREMHLGLWLIMVLELLSHLLLRIFLKTML